jgi:hypothetical protein
MSNAMTLVRSEGVDLYQDAASDHWTRDLTLAELAGMGQPRDIRKVIRKAITAKELEPRDVSARGERATERPMYFDVDGEARRGKTGAQPTKEYYLNRAACLVILRRLRTPEAQEAIDKALVSVVRAYDALTRAALAHPDPALLAKVEAQGRELIELRASLLALGARVAAPPGPSRVEAAARRLLATIVEASEKGELSYEEPRDGYYGPDVVHVDRAVRLSGIDKALAEEALDILLRAGQVIEASGTAMA